jgi:DNA-binding MarR family transcriptional regulator
MFREGPMSDRENGELPGVVTDTVRGIHRILQVSDFFSRKSLRQFGLSGPQLWALRAIRDGECTSLSDLAERTHLPIRTVVSLVELLEERGLAARRRTLSEGPTADLRLTSGGRRLLSETSEPPRSKIVRGIESLGAEDLSCLRRAVEILSRILDLPAIGDEAGRRA